MNIPHGVTVEWRMDRSVGRSVHDCVGSASLAAAAVMMILISDPGWRWSDSSVLMDYSCVV